MAIPELVKEKMTMILQEYAATGVMGTSVARAGVSANEHKKWLEDYPTYKEMFLEVKERFVDTLETTAIERAKEKSDSLLMFLLKAHRREVYGDKSEVDLKSSKGSGIQLIFAAGMLSEEEKELITGSGEGKALATNEEVNDDSTLD